MRTVRICREDELEDQGKTVVEIDGLQIGVFRLGDDFYAYKNPVSYTHLTLPTIYSV